MTVSYELNADIRHDKGKGASRRLRRNNKVPAILYGGGKEPLALALEHNVLMHHLENEAFYSHILNVKVSGKSEKAVLKDLQRHPHKPSILHLDLLRVSASEKIRMHVPLHFVGGDRAPGVKQSGGVVAHLMNDVEVSCLPKNLPEFLVADLSRLNLNETLFLSDVELPKGVEIVAAAHGGEVAEQPVASIHLTRAAVEAEVETPEAAPPPEESEG